MKRRKNRIVALILICVLSAMQMSAAAAGESTEGKGEEISQEAEQETTTSVGEIVEEEGIESEEIVPEEPSSSETESIPGISYGILSQNSGIDGQVTDGAIAGAEQSGMPVEGFSAMLYSKTGQEAINGGIRYRTHSESIGWQDWKSDGAYAGTEGESLQVEAIQMELTGELAHVYDVYYTVYVQEHGWFGWAKNGQSAGTEGFFKGIEAIRVCLVKKGEAAPGNQERCFAKRFSDGIVSAVAHIQNDGDQSFDETDTWIGTVGEKKRLEALKLSIQSREEEGWIDGGIRYRAHVQNEGWQAWKQDGAMAGTSGKSLRMEAIQMELTGELSEFYDLYYSAHVQQLGWLGWAKNGQSAGTEGFSYRMEAVRICLVPKGGAAPGTVENAFYQETNLANLRYSGHVQNLGDIDEVKNNQVLGTVGAKLRMEALKIRFTDATVNGETGGVQYRVHVQNEGWQDWKNDGELAGTTGKKLRLEAVQIYLTGALAKYYDIYYRAHVQNFGWLGWAKNGQSAGTTGYAYRMEAIQIRLIPKGGIVPDNSGYYKEYTSVKSLNVPLTYQNPQYPNGCEAISLYMALRYYGYMLTTNDICYKYLPRGPLHSTNPYLAYMGDPGSLTGGYGCWASVICQTATNYFQALNVKNRAPKNITGTSMEGLFQYIDRGIPVVVWGTLNMGSTTWFQAGSKNGVAFYWASRAHCVLLTGYDKTRKVVKVNDPIRGKVEYSFSSFEKAYKTMNQNAMVIQ